MSKLYQRFEVLLPRRFNDGALVPDSIIGETLLELEQQFGAVSSESQTIHGIWSHEGISYRDELIRVFVDVPEQKRADTRVFFDVFKERLKSRFQQIDIWMTTYPVELI